MSEPVRMNVSWVETMLFVNMSNRNWSKGYNAAGYARFIDIWTRKDERQLSGNDALCEYE